MSIIYFYNNKNINFLNFILFSLEIDFNNYINFEFNFDKSDDDL